MVPRARVIWLTLFHKHNWPLLTRLTTVDWLTVLSSNYTGTQCSRLEGNRISAMFLGGLCSSIVMFIMLQTHMHTCVHHIICGAWVTSSVTIWIILPHVRCNTLILFTTLNWPAWQLFHPYVQARYVWLDCMFGSTACESLHMTHLDCKGSVPKLWPIVSLHLQTILGNPQVVMDTGEVSEKNQNQRLGVRRLSLVACQPHTMDFVWWLDTAKNTVSRTCNQTWDCESITWPWTVKALGLAGRAQQLCTEQRHCCIQLFDVTLSGHHIHSNFQAHRPL